MIYVKVNNALYPAIIDGKVNNREWDNRESKAITLVCDYETTNALFPDGTTWSIVDEHEVPAVDEQGEPILDENDEPTYTTEQTEFDNGAFSIRGDLTVHVDGTCTVEMGKLTDLEEAYELMLGGIQNE